MVLALLSFSSLASLSLGVFTISIKVQNHKFSLFNSEMASSTKRVIITNEKKKNDGASSEVGSNGSNLVFLYFVSGKKVCRFCKREFSCGRALGGHIRLHYKEIRKRNTIKLQCSGAPSTVTTMRHNTREGEGEGEGDNHDDDGAVDLSKTLSGFGWRVQKKRGGICEGNKRKRNKIIPSVSQCYDDDDEEECFDDDDDDNDDDKMLRETLKSYGSAHKICRTRRLYRCKVCDMVFPTIHAVLCHVNESSTTDDDEEDDDEVKEKEKEKGKGKGKGKEVMSEDSSIEVDQVVAAGKDKEVAEIASKNGGGGFMNQDVSTSVPPKMLPFDLNEVPPEQED
ncbi:hypothetical protein VNO77_44767 [Canavalia gladiata]|uniref:C2H2-type domain-containing protein n=1 Tax=Canavalia gladiata TaxID=3824 RepID=A0AAN9JYT6_CANGL